MFCPFFNLCQLQGLVRFSCCGAACTWIAFLASWVVHLCLCLILVCQSCMPRICCLFAQACWILRLFSATFLVVQLAWHSTGSLSCRFGCRDAQIQTFQVRVSLRLRCGRLLHSPLRLFCLHRHPMTSHSTHSKPRAELRAHHRLPCQPR
jgi:hypothetical protein